MADAHKNFAYSTVVTAPSPATSGTSLTVGSGDGANFPAVPFNATVWPNGAQPLVSNSEIVRVTAISTDTLTIARTQEGTSARTVVVGDQIAATMTAKTLTDVEQYMLSGRALAPSGSIAETFPRGLVSTQGAAALTSGIMTMAAIYLPNNVTITSITFMSGGTALGTGTHQIFGLYDDSAGSSSGTGYALLRGTTDDTSTAWNTQVTKTLNLTSTYTTTRAGLFYIGILVAATTVPTLHILAPTPISQMMGLAPVVAGTTGAGLTALPNPASAPTASTVRTYAYVS